MELFKKLGTYFSMLTLLLSGVSFKSIASEGEEGSEAFDDPNRFNIKRKPKRHMSFGVGVHFCLGAPMARLESELALTALAENLPDLQLLGDGKRITPFFLWGRSKLPLSFRNRQEK